MKKSIICAFAASVITVSMLAGCSGSTQSKYVENKYDGFVSEDFADESFADYESIDTVAAGGINYAADVAEAPFDTGNISNTNIDPTKGRLLIRTVNITAETKSFAEVENTLKTQVVAAGGYFGYSSVSGTGKDRDLRRGTYEIRVPADKLDAIVSSVGSNCTVTSSGENTSDVTLQYVDTEARLESLKIEYDQLLELLENADDLDTIFLLQNKLTEVRYEIESTESSLLVLENQVQYATLNLTLTEVLEEVQVEEPHVVTFSEKISDEFDEMRKNTVEAFQDFILWAISALPGLIFLAVNVVIIVIIICVSNKKRRKAREANRAAKEAEAKAKEAEAKVASGKGSDVKKKSEVKEE